MKKNIFIALTIILVSCSSGPEKAAKNFTENMTHGNVDEAKKYVTPKTADLIDMAMNLGGKDNMPKYPDYKFKMVKDSIVGDSLAWVTYIDYQGNEVILDLIKQNGEWKVTMGK